MGQGGEIAFTGDGREKYEASRTSVTTMDQDKSSVPTLGRLVVHEYIKRPAAASFGLAREKCLAAKSV